MKNIQVVAAIIKDDNNKILATQRGYGEFKGGWEFPGGKVEPGETKTAALCREIREELAIDITVGKHLGTVDYDYPTFHLQMDCYVCTVVAGQKIQLLEHEAAKWLSLAALDTVDWLPADIQVINWLKEANSL